MPQQRSHHLSEGTVCDSKGSLKSAPGISFAVSSTTTSFDITTASLSLAFRTSNIAVKHALDNAIYQRLKQSHFPFLLQVQQKHCKK